MATGKATVASYFAENVLPENDEDTKHKAQYLGTFLYRTPLAVNIFIGGPTMAKVLILGGGFGGVVAAERLAKQLGDEHQLSLVSRSRHFVFYPALVRFAFGKCEVDDVSFDLRNTMLSRRVNFIEAEVARVDPFQRRVTIAHGEVEGQLTYDYLIFALGRRLATERIPGFFEHAHHLLSPDKALEFGKAVAEFHEGRAVIGQCAGARLTVPVYETAFALARELEGRGEGDRTQITVISPDSLRSSEEDVTEALRAALEAHRIELLPDFPIERVKPRAVTTSSGREVDFNLLMLLPPFVGSPVVSYQGITDKEGYLDVDAKMRVAGLERMYAVGDCVNSNGPKLGHMAVRQGEVAAANLASEIEGREPTSEYVHELKLVIDEGGTESIYVQKDFSGDEPAEVRQGRFWSWAKRVQEVYWQASHK
jgi:sulfide:quinone oxidoreductase